MARGQKNKPMAQWSEQRRENAIKYNQDHYSVVGAKLPRDVADVFRALCASQGVSVSAALSAYIRAAIQAGTLDIIPAAAPVLPADAAPEIVPAPEKSPAAGENSQAGKGTREIPSNSQKSQPFTQKFPESTRPAQWDGPKSPSDCTNPKSQPDMSDITRKSPRAPAHVGNKPASAFPPEEKSPQETPPEKSPKK